MTLMPGSGPDASSARVVAIAVVPEIASPCGDVLARCLRDDDVVVPGAARQEHSWVYWRREPGMSDVYLHIGLPKTGTTTIQMALERRVDALAEAGVLFPIGRQEQRLAAFDLVGQRVTGDERHVVGAFARLVEEMRDYRGRSIVFSDEELGLARPRHVRKVVRSLRDHRLFVILTARDMARTVVSAWQQSVVMGKATSWEDYIAAVRDLGAGDVSDALSFWLRHDLVRVIDTWAALVPPERIRVVTVPPRGAASGVLLERFAGATDVSRDIWADVDVTQRNVSFGAAELEVIRRLNQRIVGPLTARQHRFVVDLGIRPGLRGTDHGPLTLPAEHASWAREYGQQLVAELRAREIPIYGDLADLVPTEDMPDDRRPDDVSQAELLEAAEAALGSLAVAHGRLSLRLRRAISRSRDRSPARTETLASLSRRTVFRFKKLAQQHASEHRLTASVGQWYATRDR